jgi:desampylase
VTLVLPLALRAQLEAEARAAFPRECCGLIEGLRHGTRLEALALHAARNLAAAPDRFEIDPADHLRLQRAARARGTAIVGCYHSHPGGRAEPSAHDLAGASEEGFVWLIAAIDGAQVEAAAFAVESGEFRPCLLA